MLYLLFVIHPSSWLRHARCFTRSDGPTLLYVSLGLSVVYDRWRNNRPSFRRAKQPSMKGAEHDGAADFDDEELLTRTHSTSSWPDATYQLE